MIVLGAPSQRCALTMTSSHSWACLSVPPRQRQRRRRHRAMLVSSLGCFEVRGSLVMAAWSS